MPCFQNFQRPEQSQHFHSFPNSHMTPPINFALKSGETQRTWGRVFEGDCIQHLKTLPDQSIDLVVTDPPYGIRYRDRSGRKILNDDQFSWLQPSFAEVARVLKDGHYCVSFYGWANADRFVSAWKSAGLRVVGHLVFAKSYAPSTSYTEHRHESAYLLVKGNAPLPKNPLPDVLPWRYSGNKDHPSQKSVTNMATLIKAYSKEGDIVLDPFMGSASTMVASINHHRRFVGMELDPTYFRKGVQRILSAMESLKKRQKRTTSASRHA